MNNLTYPEAIAHVRTFKDFYCLKTIAEKVGMSAAYFRNVINERYGLKHLPEKNRADFVRIVSELCSVRQIITPEDIEIRKKFAPRDINGNLFFNDIPEPF